MATVILKPGKESRLARGHLWVYAGEIAKIDGRVDDGGIVDVRSLRGQWLGRGFINRRSTLTVRLLTTRPEEIDPKFFQNRLQDAIAYRRRIVNGASAYRVVYGEGDLLPGLIVDRYGDVVVLQTLALGMDVRKTALVDLIHELLHPTAIYERNDPGVRRLEGLVAQTGWLRGEVATEMEVQEGRATFLVDIARGQKTGFFLDQRDNRIAIEQLVEDADVFDAFCYTGGFAVHAALGGAKRVTGVDISEEAIHLAVQNAHRNGVADRCTFSVANVFDELRRQVSTGARYDVVILDPPAFAKTKDALPRAIGGYKEINLRALKLLRPGGILVSCSCSYHMDEALLIEVIASAAIDTHRTVRLVERRGQANDHPIHPAMPETRYLTCVIAQVT
jgi:23S rRNA (cytosine1962-C5)-methyltransferase